MVRASCAFYFNPHEREARDINIKRAFTRKVILIHTSVKLVTLLTHVKELIEQILIHTSVKLVTLRTFDYGGISMILIHTSVKLVTVHKFYTLVSIYFSIQNANVVDLH